jgi:hypothetical protein
MTCTLIPRGLGSESTRDEDERVQEIARREERRGEER